MRIGLYLQNASNEARDYKEARTEFNCIFARCKAERLDLLVCPETTISNYSQRLSKINAWDAMVNGHEYDAYFMIASQMAKQAGCPIIFGYDDYNSGSLCIYSIYCNPWASSNETRFKMYVKHTATDRSPLALPNYKNRIEDIFKMIVYKDTRIGLTICYDGYHPLFNRAYGIQGVDVLINSTGGHVNERKWGSLLRARAIENRSFAFCTMSHREEDKRNPSRVFAFSPSGSTLDPAPEKLKYASSSSSSKQSLFIYEVNTKDKHTIIEDDSFADQRASINKYQNIFFDPEMLTTQRSNIKRINENLFHMKMNGFNVVIGVVANKDIYQPEKVAQLLYSEETAGIEKSRFVIVNHWNHLDEDQYYHEVCNLARVRAIENYCAVVVVSDNINACYQSTDNKLAQLVQPSSFGYGLDLNRCGGPNALWRNKPGMMQHSWRLGYESLISWIVDRESNSPL